MAMNEHGNGNGGILLIFLLIFVVYKVVTYVAGPKPSYRDTQDVIVGLSFAIGILVLIYQVVTSF
jgi:hypothetical protein